MILQALNEYYERKASDPEIGIAPQGWEIRRFQYVVEIDNSGAFVRFHELKEGEGRQAQGKAFLVPSLGEKKGNGVKANFLWENIEYLFQIPVPTSAKPNPDLERVADQHAAFIGKLATLQGDSARIQALRRYSVSDEDRKRIVQDPLWEAVRKANPFLALSMRDETNSGWLPVAADEGVRRAVDDARPDGEENGYCLVSGRHAEIVRLEPAGIKGVYGTDGKAERTFVSFNQDPFCSYSKQKNFNAPIGKRAAFAYTTALNTLLGKNSRQRLAVGDATMVFWSARRTHFEDDFAFFFAEPPRDDPESGTERIRNLFMSTETGSYMDDPGEDRFYALGLSPNSARISVRFWEVGTVADFAGNIRRHYQDLAIVKPPKEPEFYSLWRLLVNVAVQDKSENIPPNLAGDFMRSIMAGRPYPATILQAALRRINSDSENRVKPVRAALIKAYLNRHLREHPQNNIKEIAMALDTDQPSVGYQFGRLFAVLEKIQEEASPGLNATIREKYYGSACSAPVSVFGTLMRLKNHHLAKIENKGRVVNLERLIGEIVGHVGDFPAHLDLHEQGRFAIGYYHQRQDFFTKKDN
ncbi:MAG: type I-C CRISPR-associated protein Cas8c/Csd1 [Spirochaetaceae bacterium]|nr:type I-C CRISPR-associated protein Cas8c/Csd1 [Spirochaetaceae bacterium]